MLSRLFCPRWALALAFLGAAAGVTTQSLAQVPTGSVTPADSGVAGARLHFDRALELYRAGRYAEALAELEQAANLDPGGKDLFFNLALVHEKLGQFPEAIAALTRFRELETDADERERARLAIERLRGAEQTVQTTTPPAAPCPAPPPPAPLAKVAHAPSPVLIGAASVALVSTVFGAIFGIKALSDDIGNERTSAATPAATLRQRARRAEREALVADVAFSIAVASSATFAGVWFLSPGDARERAAGITLRSYF